MRPYRGVSKPKRGKTYRVQITWRHHDRPPHNHLGRYADPVEAALAYDVAAWILHGVDAELNFPDCIPPIDLELKIRALMHSLGLPDKPVKERTPR